MDTESRSGKSRMYWRRRVKIGQAVMTPELLSAAYQVRWKLTRMNRFPKGWSEDRVRRLIEHHESMMESEETAEDEAAFEDSSHTVMEVPNELVPAVRELMARHGR